MLLDALGSLSDLAHGPTHATDIPQLQNLSLRYTQAHDWPCGEGIIWLTLAKHYGNIMSGCLGCEVSKVLEAVR